MDAIILAGGIPQPEDPLYTYSKGDAKATLFRLAVSWGDVAQDAVETNAIVMVHEALGHGRTRSPFSQRIGAVGCVRERELSRTGSGQIRGRD